MVETIESGNAGKAQWAQIPSITNMEIRINNLNANINITKKTRTNNISGVTIK